MTKAIVVPLYNEGSNTKILLTRLLSQKGFEKIVLVDCSTDSESVNWFQQLKRDPKYYQRVHFIQASKKGRASQMNRGAEICDTNVLLFLHCDTILPGNADKLVDDAIQRGYVWGRFDIKLSSGGWIYRLIETMINIRSRFRQLATGDQAMFVLRSTFYKVGGFPEIELMEDVGISKLLGQHGKPALINQSVTTSARRWQNSGPFKTIFLMWRLRFLFWLGMNPKKLAAMYRNER